MKAESRDIIISEPNPDWLRIFQEQASRLRDILGDTAIQIDHIGSTSVSGLAAKDIIDIQITVADLDAMDDFIQRMTQNNYQYRKDIQNDNFLGSSEGYRKRYFREPEGEKRIHIHVRQKGAMNQRYALLFRDYLCANSDVRDAYAIIKTRFAEIFPQSIDGYLHIKGPVMDMIYAGSEIWAEQTDWRQGDDYL
jgi:GrpB-like predicted nucleotidyltransferase (UPF0157 family)